VSGNTTTSKSRLAALPAVTLCGHHMEGDSNGLSTRAQPQPSRNKVRRNMTTGSSPAAAGHNNPQEAPRAFAQPSSTVNGYAS